MTKIACKKHHEEKEKKGPGQFQNNDKISTIQKVRADSH